jgi:replication factor C subunit 2/4
MGIWTHDKKPQYLKEIIGNSSVCKLLFKYAETSQMPNLLLVGDNGVGKRTIAHLFCKEYLKDDYAKGKLVIDGAISRGKDVICETVQEFAKRRITMKDETKRKVIIITSFDGMTHEAQNALRRIMEIEKSVRFILTTTDMSEIIEALQSRCTILKIKCLDYSESLELIEKITADEIKVPQDVAEIISLISEGDIKRIVNYVQTVIIIIKHNSFSLSPLDSFHKVFNIPPMKYIEKLLVDVFKGEAVFEGIDYILDQGHNYNDIMDILSKTLAYRTDILPEDVRYKYLNIVSEHYTEITANIVRLHMYNLFSKLALS